MKEFFNKLFKRNGPREYPIRTVHLNAPLSPNQKYASNEIMTAKYSVITFLPKFLFEQFMRLANFYFLVISIFQLSSPELAPTGRWYTFGPLCAILALTAIKELIEDVKRHKMDKETNIRQAEVIIDGKQSSVKWKNLKVGDMVKVVNDEPFPCDLLLISSSEPESICYVETSSLDGETNLKIRQGIQETSDIRNLETVSQLKGEFSYEGPNNRLYMFDGTLKLDQGQPIPVGPNQILLRGCLLKNTPWIYGLVIYTGHETKLLMNAKATPIKQSLLEKTTNRQILAIFALLFFMAIASTIGFILWNQSTVAQNAWYLALDARDTSSGSNMKQFIVFIVLFNTVVPISLYVSIEIVKFCQAIFINNDQEMYYAEQDVYATARTSNLNEELGQIEYIFSDKTGTLTRNQMEFRKCSIAGIKYGKGYTDASRALAKREGRVLEPDPPVEHKDDPYWNFYDPSLLDNLTSNHKTASMIREFLTLLAVCHTVIPERDKQQKNTIVYQAASPDEAALVTAAKYLGFYFNTRKPTSVTIMALSAKEDYEILNVLEFTSARKRMSIICRTPANKIKLFCKGADNVIMERLAPKQLFLKETTEHVEEFALEGLRTLCIAVAELKESDYMEWQKRYQIASTSLVNRAEEVDQLCDEIEQNLFLLGATGIEDKLQIGVPEAIESLMEAGIKVWMLTGDKKETAINIAYSCQLVKENMTPLVCEGENEEDIGKWLKETMESKKYGPNYALIIDGKTLTFVLQSTYKNDLIKIATECAAAICCRVSPIQKADIVTLVKKNMKCTTLAIGDGANDVSMIQSADVGIGIAGHEGLQAARSSDYAIGQFRFLKKLLFVHGHLSYRRLSKVILLSFYKTLTLYLVSFYFSFVNGFSGQLPWDRISNTLWNVIFTFFGVIILGIFEQDVVQDKLMEHPEMYQFGQKNYFFSLKVFFGWFFNSIYHSLLIFFLVNYFFYHEQIFPNGQDQDIYAVGTMLFLCVLLTVIGKISLVTRFWVVWTHVSYWGGLVVYFLVFIVCGFAFITFYQDAQALFGEAPRLLPTAQFYFTIVVVPVICLLRDFLWIYVKRTFLPEAYHIIEEEQRFKKKGGDQEKGETTGTIELVDHLEPETPALKRNPGSRRSGYAFSQSDPTSTKNALSPSILIQKYDTTKEKSEGI